MSRRQAAYAGDLLRRRTPDARYLHLGHWDAADLPEDGRPPRDLQAAQRRLDSALLDRADLRDGLSVLDVGCGVGGTLAHVAERCRDLRAVGLNLDPRQLDVCRSLAFPADATVRWVEGDACRMPFPDAQFDRVLSVEAAFHFPSRAAFLAEARRVLRPGGRLVLSDLVPGPSLATLRGPLAFALECVIDAGIGPWPELWTFEGWPALARSQGMTVHTHVDATAHTLPSYACFQAQQAVVGTAARQDAMTRAVSLLRWLQEAGHVRMVYVVLLRDGAPVP